MSRANELITFQFSSPMNDFEQAILLLRHPLNAIMSDFNDEWPHGDKKGYASLEVYHSYLLQ